MYERIEDYLQSQINHASNGRAYYHPTQSSIQFLVDHNHLTEIPTEKTVSIEAGTNEETIDVKVVLQSVANHNGQLLVTYETELV